MRLPKPCHIMQLAYEMGGAYPCGQSSDWLLAKATHRHNRAQCDRVGVRTLLHKKKKKNTVKYCETYDFENNNHNNHNNIKLRICQVFVNNCKPAVSLVLGVVSQSIHSTVALFNSRSLLTSGGQLCTLLQILTYDSRDQGKTCHLSLYALVALLAFLSRFPLEREKEI